MCASASASDRRPRLGALVLAIALLGGCGAAPHRATSVGDDSGDLVEQGRRAMAARDLDRAARALDQAIALNPRRIEAYVLRAAVDLAREQYVDGIARLRLARRMAPGNDDVSVLLGRMLVLGGDAEEGARLLEEIVARAPERYDAQEVLARHRAIQEDWPGAIAAFEAYLRARPDELARLDPTYRTDLADAYVRAGDNAKARKLLVAVLRERPDDPRARIGLAFATAVADCRRALPMLAALADLAERAPAIWIVHGRCALAEGDAELARRLGRRHAETIGDSAAGLALVGEAELALGDLAAAKEHLEAARRREPTRRRWAVRLAHVYRTTGDLERALEHLEAIGAPPKPGDDPSWWEEMGESLLASGDVERVVRELRTVAEALRDRPAILTTLGEALVATEGAEAAQPWLEASYAQAPTPRTAELLGYTLEVSAARAFARDELLEAESAYDRAARIAPTLTSLRNLGVTRLALGRAPDAIDPLLRAVAIEHDPIVWMLLGRAYATMGGLKKARAAFDRAMNRAPPDVAIEVAIEAASFELAAGDPIAAIDRLETARSFADRGSAGAAKRYRTAMTTSRHAAGLALLDRGSTSRAIAYLEDAATQADSSMIRAVTCDLAVATVATGDRMKALRRLSALGDEPCPFPSPADTQAIPILEAFADGLKSDRAADALRRLDKFSGVATGEARHLLRTSIRVLAINAADEAYRAGKLARAERHLRQARRAGGRAGELELELNELAVRIASGDTEGVVPRLESLASELPEALLHLGVALELGGDPEAALEAWRRAKRAGVKHSKLDAWIAAKERLWGRTEAHGAQR